MASMRSRSGGIAKTRRLWSIYSGRTTSNANSPFPATTTRLFSSRAASTAATSTVRTFPLLGGGGWSGYCYCPRLLFRRHFAMAPWSSLKAALELRRSLEAEMRAEKGGPTAGAADKEEEEDYTGVGKRLTKIDRHISMLSGQEDRYVEPSDSEGEEEFQMFRPDLVRKDQNRHRKRCQEHGDLLKHFAHSETFEDADKRMNRIEEFEQRYMQLPLEYRVIGEMMNLLKEASVKDRFILLQKLNRAVRIAERRHANDPNDPANYVSGLVRLPQGRDVDSSADRLQPPRTEVDAFEEDDAEEKKKNEVLLEKLNSIDKKLEEKLAIVDYTFGKKGKTLQDEIRELAQERYALTAEKKTSLRRKGFDAKVIDINRTSKMTMGGRLFRYKVIVACGNYDGIVGFAKGNSPKVKDALQHAHEKCFENLHHVERHEEHTISHAVQSKYKKTKLYLWPARTQTGVVAGRTVETILLLAGYKNIKSKVIGSRSAYNTVKAVFQAFKNIETPKDVQEKFGRTVVESYLLKR